MAVHFTQVGGRDARGERLRDAVEAAEAALHEVIADEIAVKDARSAAAVMMKGNANGGQVALRKDGSRGHCRPRLLHRIAAQGRPDG